MKLAINFPGLAAAVMILASAFAVTVSGQPPPNNQSRGRTDPLQRELQRRDEREKIESALRASPTRQTLRYPPLVLAQIREDFLRIQVVARRLAHATSTDATPKLELIMKSAIEIRKRVVRLKKNLALTGSDSGEAREVAMKERSLRPAVLSLNEQVDQFVSNPMFHEVRLANVQLSARALSDMEAIIELADELKLIAEKSKRAGGRE